MLSLLPPLLLHPLHCSFQDEYSPKSVSEINTHPVIPWHTFHSGSLKICLVYLFLQYGYILFQDPSFEAAVGYKLFFLHRMPLQWLYVPPVESEMKYLPQQPPDPLCIGNLHSQNIFPVSDPLYWYHFRNPAPAVLLPAPGKSGLLLQKSTQNFLLYCRPQWQVPESLQTVPQ